MKKASHLGLVIACIFILLSTSILLSIRSFATPIDLKVISDSSWRTSDTLVSGWERLSFDDSEWSFARSPYPNSFAPTTIIPSTTAQHIWHDPTGMSDGTTGSIEAFSVLRSN